MKNLITLLIISILCFSCINKNPSLNEEDYKIEQQNYEALKEKVSGNKIAFFKENKEAIMKKISLFKKLKDTATAFSNVNSDTLFFLKDVHLKAINYYPLSIRAEGGENVVFLPKGDDILKHYSFKEKYEQLYSCLESKEESCSYIKTNILKEFLDIKYAFVVDGFTIIKPTIENNNSFKTGLFLGTVLVYDLINNKPLYNFRYTATNSEKISYMENENSYSKQKPKDAIKRDFESNITKALGENTRKHFKFRN